MPRLTNETYLKHRVHLRSLWFEKESGFMSWLSPREQWDLHGFYAPVEYLTDKEALKYRANTSKEQPSLPQRAGRAYAHLQAIEAEQAARPPAGPFVKPARQTKAQKQDRHIVVRALLRPEIDYQKLASVFIEMARLEEEKDKEHGRKD